MFRGQRAGQVGSVKLMVTTAPDAKRIRRLREMYADEVNGGALFRGLAKHADEARREVFLQLAAAEHRHAEHWARLLREAEWNLTRRGDPSGSGRCASSPGSSVPKRSCPSCCGPMRPRPTVTARTPRRPTPWPRRKPRRDARSR